MLKSTLVAAAFSLALIVPASAENTKCDDAGWTAMSTEVEGLADAAKKEAAMKELTMAKEMLAANNLEQCLVHMDNAAKVYR